MHVFSFMLQHLYIQVPIEHKPGTVKTFMCLRQNLLLSGNQTLIPHWVVIFYSLL